MGFSPGDMGNYELVECLGQRKTWRALSLATEVVSVKYIEPCLSPPGFNRNRLYVCRSAGVQERDLEILKKSQEGPQRPNKRRRRLVRADEI